MSGAASDRGRVIVYLIGINTYEVASCQVLLEHILRSTESGELYGMIGIYTYHTDLDLLGLRQGGLLRNGVPLRMLCEVASPIVPS